MSKIFFIREMEELMTNKIKEIVLDMIMADSVEDDDKVMEAITALRNYKNFAKLVIEDMREKEADEDRLLEEIRRGPKTDGTDS